MCDTFYVRSHKDTGSTAFFAKNSDRDPNEPQCMVFVPKGSISEPGTYVKLPPYKVSMMFGYLDHPGCGERKWE